MNVLGVLLAPVKCGATRLALGTRGERKLMRKAPVFSAIALVGVLAAMPAAADHPESATYRDIQDLQYDLENLDDSLRDLNSSASRQRAFGQRAEQIRERVTRLEEQIRRHRQDPARGLGATQEEVANLRRFIAALQSDIDEAPDSRKRWDGTLQEGTNIQVRLDQTLSSETARREDRVDASVATPVRADGRVILPAGTRVRGVVDSVQAAERPTKSGRLDLAFDTISLEDGTEIPLRSRVISLSEGLGGRETAKKAGIGALLGGVLGSIVGGKKGALVGVLIGGTGGVIASAGEEVTLPAGTVLTLRLERPIVIARR